ncbi:MAG: hypothetical protein KA717_28845 [Woronichinia naegeliana WA131]|uniref:PEP-CTERM sorting domain-containing protein n=1 Tax=Woronichinia naegeliana WA131 TaxID=2824559 RepID=A0A977KTN4_9CYAN|nr:MAG: hypothetical protein KA717_28845 [Woronichinia naegeliana WA131]
MKSQILLLGALTTLTLGSIAAPSHAISLIDNFPQTNDVRNTTIDTTGNTAVSFTIPAGNTNYFLNFVTLRLGGNSPADTPVLTIRQGGALNPSTKVVANFTNPVGQGTPIVNYNFTPTTSFTFLANTRYWLYLSASTGSFTWRGSSDGTNNTPSGIATFGAYRVTTDGGATFSGSTVRNTFGIDVTAVPWETSDAVLPLSIIGFGLVAGGKRFLALKKSQKS